MRTVFFLVIIACLVAVSPVQANLWLDSELTERDDGQYFRLVDSDGELITVTARILDVGDSYISSSNRLYTVTGFNEDEIVVEFQEEVQLPDVSEILQTQVAVQGDGESNWNSIGIYHTHNAESYVPTSGTESKDDGNGDILQVGKVLADALKEAGFEVNWTDTSHIPHDGQAYMRSRRTAMDLLQNQPATLIDVHRDATPPEVYATEIDGQPSTRIRLVIGRQNQNREANLEFAKRIKAVADEQFPDLIEGIFDARGNYNQDIGPQSILLEFGAHTNPLDQAQQAAEFFSKVIPAAAGISGAGAASSSEEQVGGAARRSIWWILGIVALLVVGFVVLNKQGLSSITGFFGRESGLGNKDDDDQSEQ